MKVHARSYYRRTVIWFLLLAGLPCLFLLAFFLFNEYRSGILSLQEVGSQLQRGLAEGTKEGFLTGEASFFSGPASAALANPDVLGVLFRDEKGYVLYSAGEVPQGLPPLDLEALLKGGGLAQGRTEAGEKRLYYATGAVKSWKMEGVEQLFGLSGSRTERSLGTVTVLLSPRRVVSTLRTHLLQSLVVTGLFLAVAALVAFYLARRVTAPVYHLVGAFQEVDLGNFSPSIPVPREPVLQLLVSQFTASVRRMKDLIREKDAFGSQLLSTAQELEELNANLEAKIAERTQSLENAVQMLEYSNRKIQEADRLKSQFLANMSHELRTPLNAVIGFSELMLERIPGPLTSEQEQCLCDIHQSGQHLLKLINEILDLSKVEAGKMPLHFTTRSGEELVAEVQALFKPILAKKGQSLTVQCDTLEAQIYTDQGKLKQILINLLSNAHKFSPEGAPVFLSVENASSCHRFSVTDQGVGIPKEHLDLIFEAFRQLDGSMRREQEGTGLGLTLCRRFSELLGGTLTVESAVGRGSTFTLLLPLDPSRPLARELSGEAANGARAAG